jgi:hypothetical protein
MNKRRDKIKTIATVFNSPARMKKAREEMEHVIKLFCEKAVLADFATRDLRKIANKMIDAIVNLRVSRS